MKKIFNIFLIIILSFFIGINVDAASASISVSNATIEKGSSVKATVTIKEAAAWNLKIYSSGATSGCDANYADATSDGKNATKSFTVTCKSTQTGLINISFSGDVTSESGVNTAISGSKNVKVKEPRAKSTNNDLASLSVEGYEISPEFSKDVLEYKVDVPNTVDKITIRAKALDSYADVSGTGEMEVMEGSNKFVIVVTSETGQEKLYTLNVNVEDLDPILVSINDKEYSLIKNKKALIMPELFTETTIDINGVSIPAFYSDITKITLVGLKDLDGNVKLFIYKDGNYSEYRELKVANIILMLTEIKEKDNYIKDSIIINDIKYDCLKVSNNSKYALFSGINMANGKENYYLYDSLEQTIQRYDEELINILQSELTKKSNNITILYIVITVISVFTVIIIILFSIKNNKIKKALTNDKIKIKKSKSKKEKTIIDA